MQTDFNFNLQYRQQALTRNPRNYQYLPPRGTTTSTHGCHVFCKECFSRIFLGTAAFKLYLLVAWCIGLAGLMYLQKPDDKIKRDSRKSDSGDDETRFMCTAICLIYLFSQICGLLAVVTQIERIFVPYVLILVIVHIANVIFMSQSVVTIGAKLVGSVHHGYDLFGFNPYVSCVLSILFLFYNWLCVLSVVHLCSHFDKKRLLAERRHRETIAYNARIYNRLVELSNRDQAVTINVDSPPKYSTLETKPITTDTPPPGYSQLKMFDENEQNEKKSEKKGGNSSRRALFQESAV